MRTLRLLWTHIVVACCYLLCVLLTFQNEMHQLFFFLTLPWSFLTTVFGWLLIHTLSGGMEAIYKIEIAGALVNAVIYLSCLIVIRKYDQA